MSYIVSDDMANYLNVDFTSAGGQLVTDVMADAEDTIFPFCN